MIDINNKRLCECCFTEISSEPCPACGYTKAGYLNDPSVLPCGSILVGRYIIGRVIGKGGFGVTYLAYDSKMDRKIAIKEFFPNGLAHRNPGNPTVVVSTEQDAVVFQQGAEKFYNEAQLVSRFNGNPGIVSVYEFFYENDTVYFSMEFLNGRTLKSWLDKNGAISEAQAVFIADRVSSALLAAHSSNVMHRDISPDNIMLCDDGSVKLIDFGAARQLAAEGSQNLSVILKPGFAPLEQYQRKGKQGPWTDIYSLGATLYYALTLDTIDDPMSRMEDDQDFQSNKHNISAPLWEVIRTATNLKIPDRYQDIFVFRTALSGSKIAPEPIIAQPQMAGAMPGFTTAHPFASGMTSGVTAETVYPTPAQQYSNQAAPDQQYSSQPAPGQQYSSQPAPGQQYSGQPAPGQQYSGQPAPAQQYSSQPAPGQQYSNQPASGQTYVGQTVPMQEYAPTAPVAPAAAPKKKNKLVIGIVIAAAVALAGVATAIVVPTVIGASQKANSTVSDNDGGHGSSLPFSFSDSGTSSNAVPPSPGITSSPDTSSNAVPPSPGITSSPDTTSKETDPPSMTTAPPVESEPGIPTAKYEIYEPSGSILTDFTQKYYYNRLSNDMKGLYSKLYEAIINFEPMAYFGTSITDTEFDLIRLSVVYDNPQFFYLENINSGADGSTTASAKINYLFDDQSEIISMQGEINTAVKDILDSFSYDSDLSYLNSVYDWLTLNMSIGTGDIVYDGFTGDSISSWGFADCFSYLCQLHGIKCCTVGGTRTDTDEEWKWNRLVFNGSWYAFDVAFDAQNTDELAVYDHFMLSDDVMNKDHSMDYDYPSDPAYSVYIDTVGGYPFFYDADEAYDYLENLIIENLSSGVYETTITGRYCDVLPKVKEKLESTYSDVQCTIRACYITATVITG